MQYTYKILLHKEPEGGFTVTVPALPGCITYGDDTDEATAMAKEAIELYIEELQSRGDLVPMDDIATKQLEKTSYYTVNTVSEHIHFNF